ncbi:MAG TPA: hypothetical protein VNG33_16390 [Polyangiaceae bacterium]|nr:hypothetical protein [Polyangiaceae bacterium]
MKQAIRGAALAVLTVSCAPAGAPINAPPAEPASVRPSSAPSAGLASTRATDPTQASPEDAKLQKRLTSALAYISEIRHLPALSAVRGRSISRPEIEAYLTAQLDAETPTDVIQATEALLYGFGTVDADFDFRASVIKLMTSQLLGFYDPKQKTFFVGGDLAGDEADVTLWHELVHALQDQHYDLTRLSDWQPDMGDSQAAVHALAEGDATSAMIDGMLKPRGATALEVPEGLMRAQSVLGSAALSAPPVLVRSLLAPYVDGLLFTNYLRSRGGFAAVDEAWRSPPTSTEQLLHPEKFLAHEPPLVVPLPPPPASAPELSERFHDVMGEQTLRLLFEEWLPARTAAAAAADWGGDRLSVFADDARKRWAVGWHLRFDSPAAAERALIALVRAAPLTERGAGRQLDDEPRAPRPSVKVCRERHSQGPIALVRHGTDLGVAIGPFQRSPTPVATDPACAAAVAWATKIANN